MRTLAAAVALLVFPLAHAVDLALVGGSVYPEPNAIAISDAVVLIRDGVITEIGPSEAVRLPDGVQRIDCSGRWIVAGFWNSHVHLLTPELLRAEEKSTEVLQQQLDEMFNRWGFAHVFDLASDLKNTLVVRKRIESGELRGPNLLTCGQPLWTEAPIYIRAYLEKHSLEMPVVRTEAEAAAQVNAAQQEGVNGVKLFTGSMQGQGAVANMPVELVRGAARAAQTQGLPVFSHAQNMAGLEAAIEGGVDVIVHTIPQSSPWTPELVARLKNAKMALIPTLTLFAVEGRRAQMPAAAVEGWLQLMTGQLQAYSAAGGEVLFGTDIGYIEEYDTRRELELMSRAGMDFPKILAALTTAPATRFGRNGESGRVIVGAPADLVVLAADPAANVTALADVRLTVRAGRVTYQQPR